MKKKQNKELLEYLAKQDKRVGQLLNRLINELAEVGLSINNIPDDKLFTFADYPEKAKQTTRLLQKYTSLLTKEIKQGIKDAFIMSFAADNAVLSATPTLFQRAMQHLRTTAVSAFIDNRMKPSRGLSLSQKVWNYLSQTKAEFEIGMSESVSEGLRVGISAEELGRSIRGKLNNPDAMYRRYHEKKVLSSGKKIDVTYWRKRVIDEDGKAHFVKGDIESVGRGVYRSAHKNALRLTRTEINMAYRYADIVRWQNEPFVIGFRIQLSGNHTLNGKPFVDMCDELVGDYPKFFYWSGWHPQCRCIITPIQIPLDEMREIQSLPEEEYAAYQSPNLITQMPQAFQSYIETNRSRIMDADDRGTLPYWVRDNRSLFPFLVGKDRVLSLGDRFRSIKVSGSGVLYADASMGLVPTLMKQISKVKVNRERVAILKEIVADKAFIPLSEKSGILKGNEGKIYGLYPDGSKSYQQKELPKNLSVANKLAKQGYEVYLMPNPKVKSFDYVLKDNKGRLFEAEAKILTGDTTLGKRIEELAGQSIRGIVDIQGSKSVSTISKEIEDAYNSGLNIKELWLFKGSKLIKTSKSTFDRKKFEKLWVQ